MNRCVFICFPRHIHTRIKHVVNSPTQQKKYSKNPQVHPDSDGDDFLLELSSLLKEMHCPYSRLLSCPTAERFKSEADRILLFEYLTSELMAAKMSRFENPDEKVVIEVVSISVAYTVFVVSVDYEWKILTNLINVPCIYSWRRRLRKPSNH